MAEHALIVTVPGLLDLTALSGIVSVDTTSMLVDVRAGTFGDVFEDDLQAEYGVKARITKQLKDAVKGFLAGKGIDHHRDRHVDRLLPV